MAFSIRTLKQEDAEALLVVEAQAQSGMASLQLKDALAEPETAVLGGFRADMLVGYALLAKLPFDAELHAIGVLPAHRGGGVGQALMDAVMATARRWQSERLLLEVRASNQAAIALYQRMGFREDGRRKGYYPPPLKRGASHPDAQSARPGAVGREDALLMSRKIAS